MKVEVEKLKFRDRVHKEFIELIKDEVNILKGRLEDTTCCYDKAIGALIVHAEKETH